MTNESKCLSYITYPNDLLCDFPKFEDCDFMNANYINPLKQHDVKTIVDQLSQDSKVRGIIVFGSAVEMRCSSYSDLDLFIIKDEMMLDLDYSHIQSELDILWSCSAGDRLLSEIKKKGVLVYCAM